MTAGPPHRPLRHAAGLRRHAPMLLLLLALPAYFLDYAQLRALGVDRYPELFGVAHVLFFLAFGLWLQRLPRVRRGSTLRRLWIVVGLATLLGLAIELLQPLVGRSTSPADLLRNLAGAGAALAIGCGPGRPGLRILATALMLGAACGGAVLVWIDRGLAAWSFPELAGFEQPLEVGRWDPGVIDGEQAREGEASLRVALAPGRYAGVAMDRSIGDWRGFDALQLSLRVEAPLTVTVSIADGAHFRAGGAWGDRYDGEYALRPGWNDLHIPLSEIACTAGGRFMDLADLERFGIFTTGLKAPATLWIDAVRLVAPKPSRSREEEPGSQDPGCSSAPTRPVDASGGCRDQRARRAPPMPRPAKARPSRPTVIGSGTP